jgi:hypothetical protein
VNKNMISNISVFLVNGVVTYFVGVLATFGFGGYSYFSLLALVVASSIVFTIYPKRKFFDRPNINFFVKIGLHVVTSYILMVIFGNLK